MNNEVMQVFVILGIGMLLPLYILFLVKTDRSRRADSGGMIRILMLIGLIIFLFCTRIVQAVLAKVMPFVIGLLLLAGFGALSAGSPAGSTGTRSRSGRESLRKEAEDKEWEEWEEDMWEMDEDEEEGL